LPTDDENLTPKRQNAKTQRRKDARTQGRKAARSIRLWAFFSAAFHLMCDHPRNLVRQPKADAPD
jgi:hypothetical protein